MARGRPSLLRGAPPFFRKSYAIVKAQCSSFVGYYHGVNPPKRYIPRTTEPGHAKQGGRGGPLRYQSVQEHWATDCVQSGLQCPLHHLRHLHATELINGGVSLATIGKRLGHKHVYTTLRYAEQADTTADAELWNRRRQRQSRS